MSRSDRLSLSKNPQWLIEVEPAIEELYKSFKEMESDEMLTAFRENNVTYDTLLRTVQ
jgi:hypothetical protein